MATSPLLLESPPKGISIQKDQGVLLVKSSFFSWKVIGLVIMTVLWSLGSVGSIIVLMVIERAFNFLLFLFMLPFLISSFYLWYTMITLLFGRLQLTLKQQQLLLYKGGLFQAPIALHPSQLKHLTIETIKKESFITIELSHQQKPLIIGRAMPLYRLQYLHKLLKKIQKGQTLPTEIDFTQHLID